MRFILLYFTMLSVMFGLSQQSLTYPNGNALLTAMHQKYKNGKWYTYMTFSQNMEFYRNDSVIKKDVWHEAAMFPGKLLIKFEKKDSKNGVLFSDFKVTAFREGHEPETSPMVHDLLLLGFDVYFYDPNTTSRILDSLGYNLSIVRTDTFNGRNVYVVGAEKGDLKSRQFWIDAERLYVHRIIYKQKNKTNEVIFADYYQQKKFWVSPTVIFKTNGKLSLIERYYDIKLPRSIPKDWFDPTKFNSITL